jgi:uncharacterized YigZ family protein
MTYTVNCMKQSYFIPSAPTEFSEEIKKSRFITYLAPAPNVAHAKEYIQLIKRQHLSARHHCWAFVAGAPNDPQVLGFSDDGEPSGTAGKPMLAQLLGSGLGEVVAVAVRYYGGILLGTGGLVKAYGNGVQQALKQLSTFERIPFVEYLLNCDYHQLKLIETVIIQSGGQIVHSTYAERVELKVCLPVSNRDTTINKLQDIAKGSLILLPIE